MKNSLKTSLAIGVMASILSVSTLTSNAATVDDCAAVARSYGISEAAIQSAYNAYYADPDSYTSEHFDEVIATLHFYGTDSQEMINNYFGIETPPATDSPTPTPSENSSSGNSENSNNSSNNSKPTDTSTTPSNSSNSNSSNPPSSSNFNREDYISSSDFINMSIDDKVNYVQSLPADQQQDFMNNLSQEEKNSIIKQFSTEDKMNIISNFVAVGDSMGLNFTVDDLTNDKLAVSIRDANGNLIDQSALGVVVEDTGYDYRTLISIIAIALTGATTGIYLIFKKISKEEKEYNE